MLGDRGSDTDIRAARSAVFEPEMTMPPSGEALMAAEQTTTWQETGEPVPAAADEPTPAIESYRVSDALPLFAFGLGPPPPALAPSSLLPSLLAVAAAAAQATAAALAVVPERPPSATLPEAVVPTATVPGLPDAATSHAEAATDLTGHGTFDSATTATGAVAPHPLPSAPPRPDALATLDLSRRQTSDVPELPHLPTPATDERPLAPHDMPAAQHPPPPDRARGAAIAPLPPPFPIGPQPMPAPRQAPALPSLPMTLAQQEPQAGWPGFLTGFAVALAIGIGLYVTLVGG